jgi:hypothetical protein
MVKIMTLKLLMPIQSALKKTDEQAPKSLQRGEIFSLAF